MHYAAIPMKTVQLGFELENLHSPHFLAIQLFQRKYLGCYLAAVSLSQIYLWDELTQDAQHIVRLHIIIGRVSVDVAPFDHLKISIFKYATALFDVLPAAQCSRNVKQGQLPKIASLRCSYGCSPR